ncbi:MAG TPA: CDP-diacylglycerol--glycerol-3-phosphate 3-phosphatidyltransferase [Spirochaetota bacterium]|nr:CDP-diacylglycerol--glycerol-3-phosphate 3-phosphatidyltransferase [Spirochaetota bacterium]HRZ25486.1 CDP-diacylglycerol--glycerol-3-phosphate 3-phosphatidyltransferase [Spirochaetota bacterium]HSA14108.1 CDP-diacylglycerol--glycerol-3-phosphate 3-phosphatidyltransferase [Spirochaetota bacterium]
MKIAQVIFYIPNLLSISRIVLIPLFVYLLFIPTVESKIWSLVVFAVASLTDLLDGWSARKFNQESELGKFLDPLADKFLVISALIAILVLDPYLEIFDAWMIVIILGRDVLITVMRYLAIKKGTTLRTSRFGKVKTAFQMTSIVLIIMIYIVRKSGYDITHVSLPYWIMFTTTMLTALSGIRYLVTNGSLFFPAKKTEQTEQ